MASWRAEAVPTGHAMLDNELPHGGWPAASLTELLLREAGIGEMQLLRPALRTIAGKGRIALVQPPHPPQLAAWLSWGLPAERLLWVKPDNPADAIWSAEQILRNGSCGALLFWQPRHAPTRHEVLRRLHLIAQGTDMVFWMLRPLVHAQDPSPAPLRLALHPANGGITVDIAKRRGPRRDEPLHISLDGLPKSRPHPISPDSGHALMDRHTSAAPAARSDTSALV
jgi:protein ImuA